MDINRFDRELTLADLLDQFPAEQLAARLAALLGGSFRLMDDADRVLLSAGDLSDPSLRQPLRLDFDDLGCLEAPTTCAARLQPCADILLMLLQGARRALMMSDLQMQVVHEDYEALTRKNEALLASEARYRELAGQLEQRVTEQVRTIEQTHLKLYQSERMAAIGRLAAGIAHEINNPFAFVRSNLNTARKYLTKVAQAAALAGGSDSHQMRDFWAQQNMDAVLADFDLLLEESILGADRVAALVSDFKQFANVDQEERRPIDLNASIRTVCNITARPENVRIDLQFEPGDLPPVNCMPGHIHTALHHILENAFQAVSAAGVVRIRTGVEAGWVTVAISDSGAGIAPADLPRVFDPFFTTRAQDQGRGLGLTISQDIARAHGGRIEAFSRPGAGSTFTLYLPAN